MLKTGKISDALDLISDEPSPPLEIYLLKAQALSLSGNYLEAVMLLKSIRDASKRNLRFCTQLIQHQFEAKDGSDLKQNLTEALSLFGEHPQLLHHCTSLNLFQRQPGLARRSALLQQTWARLPQPLLRLVIKSIPMKRMALPIGRSIYRQQLPHYRFRLMHSCTAT